MVFALGQLRDVRAIPGLTIALKDANEEVRQRAAFALSQLRDPRAVDPLLIAAKDANPDVRRQALFAIGQIDASRGKDAAIEALKDKDAEVRRMAAAPPRPARPTSAISPTGRPADIPGARVRPVLFTS